MLKHPTFGKEVWVAVRTKAKGLVIYRISEGAARRATRQGTVVITTVGDVLRQNATPDAREQVDVPDQATSQRGQGRPRLSIAAIAEQLMRKLSLRGKDNLGGRVASMPFFDAWRVKG